VHQCLDQQPVEAMTASFMFDPYDGTVRTIAYPPPRLIEPSRFRVPLRGLGMTE
jgi:hypothetical protein